MSNLLRRRFLALGVVAAMSAATAPAFGAADGVDERADRLVRVMSEYLKVAPAFSFDAEVLVDHVLADGQKLEYARRATVWVRRPDRMHVEIQGDLEHERYWYDGRQVTILDLDENVYKTLAAPDNLDALLDFLEAEHDISSPVGDFLYSDPYAVLTQYARRGYYVGLHAVRGERAHHLAFRQEHVDWQIWIADGPMPVPRKLIITYKKVPSTPEFRVVLSGWDFQTRLPDAAFEFIPPEGAGVE